MNEDYLYLDLPMFKPNYEEHVRYSFSNEQEKDRLRELLCKTTNGYCMYCYTRIFSDGKINADIEHGVEKNLNDKLKDCLPNLGLACRKCNQSYKRRGEMKKEHIPLEVKEVLECFNNHECKDQALCRDFCDDYNRLRGVYTQYRNIVLQPALTSTNMSIIQYDVKGRQFIPNRLLDEEKREIVEEHIKKFCLNDTKYRTKELIRFCEDVVNGVIKPVKGRYNNLIVDVFVEKINDLDEKEYRQLCGMVVKISRAQRDYL